MKSIERAMVVMLVAMLAAGSAPAMVSAQQQAAGVIAGKAADEAKKPYADYVVQLRDVATGQVVKSVPLDPQAQFSITGLAAPNRYLVELFQTKDRKVVCTEGPFALSSTALSKTDVNINCGTNPAVWVLTAAGAAAAVAFAVRSASQ